jgi:putative FmdB family regulatory protein
MPIYSYRCTNPDCLSEQDFLQNTRDTLNHTCPDCGSPMKRMLSAVRHKFVDPRGTMGIIDSGTGRREKHT